MIKECNLSIRLKFMHMQQNKQTSSSEKEEIKCNDIIK